MMHQADECSDLPSNVPSSPFPRSRTTGAGSSRFEDAVTRDRIHPPLAIIQPGSGTVPGRFVRSFFSRLSKNNEKIRKACLMSAAIATPPSPTSMPIPSFGRIEPGQTVIRSGRLYLMHGTVDDARARY